MLSSVARGRGVIASPIGMQSMQNTLFLVLLRPIFKLKAEIAPPSALKMRMWLFWPWTWEEVGRNKSIPTWQKIFFFIFGLQHLISGTKPFQTQVKTFFLFDLHPILSTKPLQFQMWTVSVWFYISETVPSHWKFLATAYLCYHHSRSQDFWLGGGGSKPQVTYKDVMWL